MSTKMETLANSFHGTEIRVRGKTMSLPSFRDCGCPQRPDGSLNTPRSEHLCALRGKRPSGKGGPTSPAVRKDYERKRLRVCVPPGAYASGKDRALAAAQKAGLASVDELVTAAIEHVEAGRNFSSR